MIQQVLSFVQQHHMIEKGQHILVGVSGGADSVCLLLVLKKLQEYYDCQITVVHVEHGIRGDDSLRDAEFVKKMCEKHRLECKIYYCDALAFSKEQGMSLEEGARELRYQYFRKIKEELQADKIAIAHNQNDCAETLLFHLARGSGLRGMCGIAPVREEIIRPLLCVSREQIEAFLKQEQQEFCIDATNLETEYSRNKIRHQIIPVMQTINMGAVAHLYKSTEYMTEAVELVEQLAKTAKPHCISGNTLLLSLLEQPLLIQKTLILEALGACAGSRKDLSGVHVEQILGLFQKQVGRTMKLPYGMEAQRTYKGVSLEKKELKQADTFCAVAIDEKKWCYIENYNWTITSNILEKKEEIVKIPKKKYTKWFDYDKIENSLLLRRRCPGDYFVVDALGREQKLKKYFINEKIPAKERERVLLLADGQHILWMIGYRISEAYKVTENTKRILEIRVEGENIYE